MPCTKELAQLPTPTIATRTFSSRAPLRRAPFALPLTVLMSRKSSWIRSRGFGNDTYGDAGLHDLGWDRGLDGRLLQIRAAPLELVSHMPNALYHGESRQRRHSVDRRCQKFRIDDPGALRE